MKETERKVQGKYTDKLYTLNEAAAYLRMGVSTLYQKARRGNIPCKKPDDKYLFVVDDLDAYIEKQEWEKGGAI